MSLNVVERGKRRGKPRLVRTAVEAGSEAEVFALLAKRLARAIDDGKTLTRDLPPLTSRFVEVYDRYQKALEVEVEDSRAQVAVVSDVEFDVEAI
mgnify:CR=1 FL=1|jgi:hypothetical protein